MLTKLTRKQSFTVIGLALFAITLAVYWPVTRHEFVNYDDHEYVTDNPHVNAGLTWAGVGWAFQNSYSGNWHPLTWISHMLDCQWYGLNPSGHHLTNLLFHIANSLLLFLWLERLTGALWRSAFVAALFAWHPLHVESVAWVAERKDVLSTFFWMLALLAYTRYAQKQSSAESRESMAGAASPTLDPRPSTLDYFLALFFFACGLMSKPMVVTLPFVLLLLDFWPLGRVASGEWRVTRLRISVPQLSTLNQLLLEKLPFFALAVGGSVVTYLAQKSGGALWSSSSLPLSFRLENALISYLRYLAKAFWPTDLAVIYPYPNYWPILSVIGAALLLLLWSGLFLWYARQRPYLFVGWFWFLGTLVPAIGLVQVGVQSMADRYMYIPSIGLFLLLVWGLNDLLRWQPRKRQLVAIIGTAALGSCLVGTAVQLRYWTNSLRLFSHTAIVTTGNYAAYVALGQVTEQMGRSDDALTFYREAVRIEPTYPLGQFQFGMSLLEHGQPAEAFGHLKAAADLMPQNPDFEYNLGVFLALHDKPEDAIGRFDAALRFRPDFPQALNQLAWIQATSPNAILRDGVKALGLAQRACALTGNRQPAFLTTLSAAYAETGRFPDAIAAAQQARTLALAAGQKGIAAKDEELLRLYQGGQPFREKN